MIPCGLLEEESKLEEQQRLELSRITLSLHRIHALLRERSSGEFKLLLISEFYQIK